MYLTPDLQLLARGGKAGLISVTKPRVLQKLDQTEVSFFIRIGDESHEIWFRAKDLPDSDYSNVALATTLLPAMKLNLPLRLEGCVSSKLLEGTAKIQDIFHVWDNSFNKIHMIPQGTDTKSIVHDEKAACFFSGGVDSFYSLFKNEKEITHIILIHGFDFQHDFSGKEEVVDNIAQVASRLGKTLIQVETNLRDFTDKYVPWDFCHGSALAAVALLLSGTFSKVLIPSSHSFRWLTPWGSHPVVDPLWSTESMELIHDGCEAARIKKVAEIAKNDVAMSYLRVCWENGEGAYNCGKCEKCLRTMINLLAVGALWKCKTLTRPLELGRVAWIEIKNESTRDFVIENLNEVQKRKTDPALQEALETCLEGLCYRGIWSWPKRAFKFFKRGGFRRAINI